MVYLRAVPDHKIVGINKETVSNTTSLDFPGHFYGQDNSWDLEKFKQGLQVHFHKNERFDATFSLIGVDASIANAFRRIMFAEVPSLAIEHVYMYTNTSIIQDEVLAHRIGLIPLKGNQAGLRWLRWFNANPEPGVTVQASDCNTVVLQLSVQCTWKENGKALAKQGVTDPKRLYNHSSVYAHQIDYVPHGQQTEYFSEEAGPIAPTNPDILIAKLRPGQVINMTLHCVKGVGGDHAKFSPVATASYRLMPVIRILKPILGADAVKFARCFPRGVVKVDKVSAQLANQPGSGYEGHEGEDMAVVVDPMRDTVSRECLRHPEFEGKVKLGREQDHFIFRVESVGQAESDDIFLESVRILKAKCLMLKRDLAANDFR